MEANENGAGRGQAEFWKRHLEAWESSGLSQSGYCRHHQLKFYRFRYWKRKLRHGKAGGLRLVAIQAQAQPAPVVRRDGGIRLLWKGLTVEVGEGFDPRALKTVMNMLVGRACGE